MISLNIIISLLIIAIGIFLPNSDNAQKKFCIFIGIIFIAQNAFRSIDMTTHTSNDTYRYFLQYAEVSNMSLDDLIQQFSFLGSSYDKRDLGFPIFIKLTQMMYPDFRFFLFIVAVIVVVPIVMLIYTMSPSKSGIVTACLLYQALFANFFQTGIRQTIVMGMLYFAFRWVLQHKEWKFVLTVIITTTIHSSAWCFLPIAFINFVKTPKKVLLIMLCAAPLIMMNAKNILALIGSGTMYSGYAIDSIHNQGTPVFSALILIIGILIYYTSDKIQNMYPDYANAIILAVGCSVVLTPSSWIDSNFIRIVFYYALFITVAVPCAIDVLWYNNIAFRKLSYILVNSVLLLLMLK